jgi:hypothetical protein
MGNLGLVLIMHMAILIWFNPTNQLVSANGLLIQGGSVINHNRPGHGSHKKRMTETANYPTMGLVKAMT